MKEVFLDSRYREELIERAQKCASCEVYKADADSRHSVFGNDMLRYIDMDLSELPAFELDVPVFYKTMDEEDYNSFFREDVDFLSEYGNKDAEVLVVAIPRDFRTYKTVPIEVDIINCYPVPRAGELMDLLSQMEEEYGDNARIYLEDGIKFEIHDIQQDGKCAYVVGSSCGFDAEYTITIADFLKKLSECNTDIPVHCKDIRDGEIFTARII